MLAAVKLTSATRQNLWRLTFIRTLVLAAQAGSVGLAYWFKLLPLPWLQLAVTLGFSTVLCVFTVIRLRTTWPVTELEYALQLACDLFIHSVLLYFSGGSTNPRNGELHLPHQRTEHAYTLNHLWRTSHHSCTPCTSGFVI